MKDEPLQKSSRVDYLIMAGMIANGARVLDVGCGDGDLLELLVDRNGVDGRGVEISRDRVNSCVARGLSVIQGDADFDLDIYPDRAFDYAVLSLTIQACERPRHVLEQLLRIGRHAIVSFPNFAHWRNRAHVGLLGRMPINDRLPNQWFDTPNIHLCSIKDFEALCQLIGASVEQSVALDSYGQRFAFFPSVLQNLFATQAVFLLTRP